MENRKIKINYQDSGVKTANSFGTFFFVIGVIAILVAIIGLIMYLSNIGSYYESYRETAAVGVALASSFFPIAIGSFAAGAICKTLSTIAMTSLYKRALLEDQYSFVDSFMKPTN